MDNIFRDCEQNSIQEIYVKELKEVKREGSTPALIAIEISFLSASFCCRPCRYPLSTKRVVPFLQTILYTFHTVFTCFMKLLVWYFRIYFTVGQTFIKNHRLAKNLEFSETW